MNAVNSMASLDKEVAALTAAPPANTNTILSSDRQSSLKCCKAYITFIVSHCILC